MKKFLLLVAIFFAIPLAWGAEVYTSNLDNTTLTGATVTVSNCALAPAPTWGSGFTNAFLTSSSSGYATIEFDPALDLSGYDNVELAVQWGSASSRPLNASFNGGSNVSISGNLPSADRSKVVSSSCAISVSTLNSLKLVSSGGGSVYFFAISITGTSSCSATQPGSINKGIVSGGVITLTAGGSPAASDTWYWQTAADGTATTESGATKNVSAAGTYYIRSHHNTEDCWSAATSITVNAEDFLTPSSAPTITSHPVSATYEIGETVIPLTVSANGSGTLSYQWKKDGVDIPGQTSDSYMPTRSGSYTCVVSNKEDASHSPTSVESNAAIIVIKSNTYLLQGISGSSGTGTLTGDFFTTALMTTTTTASYDGVDYSTAMTFAGNCSSWNSYSDRMVRYDCKTTRTVFTIIAYNKHNSTTQKLYIGHIIENAIGSANTVSSYTGYDVTAKSQITQSYEIFDPSLTPRSLYVSVGKNDYLGLVQIIAEEKGIPLPFPGSVGYKVNFNKTRIAARQNGAITLDGEDFEYLLNENVTAGTNTSCKIQTKGTHYIKFRALEDCFVNIAVSSIGKGFWLADDQGATVNASDLQYDGDKTYSMPITAGIHYIVPNGANMQISSLVLSEAVHINFNANGGIGSMNTQLVPSGVPYTLPTSEFSKPGFIFSGWTEDAGGIGPVIEDEATITPTGDITLYAKWSDPCAAIPILKPAVEKFTIWNNKEVDLTLMRMICKYDTTTVKYSLKSVSESIDGCTFKFYNAQIHLVGTPTGYTTCVTKNITFTFNNNCAPESIFTITIPIQINPTSMKPRLAYIVTGTEGNGNFSDYNTANETNSSALLAYLGTYYDITCVNGYATKDPDAIAAYYAQYDLLIVTDYMETPKGYTNAIGTLIDKKPILSFEAYVAGENGSNWHIHSNPVDPSPKVKDMTVLCAGHSVFGGGVLEPDGETVKVLSSISGKGLQGFVINEAPDFLFLATIHDDNGGKPRDLIVCCERQMVFPARLMLYGINYNEMGNISDHGKLAMKQMIDYLLLTDETKVADCALVFDNKSGDHKWSNPGNWAPGHNIVPTAYHPTRIIAPCEVDIENAHASSVKINVGKDHFGNPLEGRLTILPQGGLVVAGFINKVNDTRYANLLETTAEDIIIQANEDYNGALVFGNKETDVCATVQYYSRGEASGTSNPVWQYMGIPVQAEKTAITMYHEAWMCRWAEDSGLGGLWQWVRNEDILVPFEGYCITQDAKKTYTLQGKLNEPISHTLKLNVRDGDGFAFAANSWTAPIKVNEMADDDFINAEKTIYIYHTGSFNDYGHNGTPIDATTGKATLPGQYAVVPIHSTPYVAGADSVIPSMQGFFIKTNGAGARVDLMYNRVVYDSKFFKTTASPTRAPKQAKESGEPDVMHIGIFGAHGADRVHLLARSDFSEDFADGWDGRKIDGDTAIVPTLAVIKEAGEMSVAAVNSFDERELNFRAGCDTEYTFSFNYNGETIYLYDRLTGEATEIKTGNTYSFTADNKTAAKRFLITKNPPRMPTGIGDITVTNLSDAEKCIIDGQLYIIKDNRFYDARGVRVTSFKRKEVAP